MSAPISRPERTRCGMCGYEFDASQLTCHAACPLGAHCMVVCCPRCGYSTVDPARSSLTKQLSGLFKRSGKVAPARQAGDEAGAVRLLDLRPGQSGHVADVEGEADTLMQLSQYGLLPGTPVRLACKHPVPIVQVGQTDLALDRTLAAQIYVDL